MRESRPSIIPEEEKYKVNQPLTIENQEKMSGRMADDALERSLFGMVQKTGNQPFSLVGIAQGCKENSRFYRKTMDFLDNIYEENKDEQNDYSNQAQLLKSMIDSMIGKMQDGDHLRN